MAFTFSSDFDPQPTLHGNGVSLQPLCAADREALAMAASDPLIWAGHPNPNRHERAVFEPYFDMLLATGSAMVIRDHNDRIIGCTVYYVDTNAPSRLSIGFTFLVCDHWGGATNRIVKRLMLGHLFTTASEAWFHIGPTNLRSQMATTRLGAVFTHEADIDLAGSPARWKCYCLTRENWHENDRQRSGLPTP
jgi:RimJ/RimL family protein N-acetyltransferase